MHNVEYRPISVESEAMQEVLEAQPKQAENIQPNREHAPVVAIPRITSDRVANCDEKSAAAKERAALRLACLVLGNKFAEAPK
jgi:hypothetical protein